MNEDLFFQLDELSPEDSQAKIVELIAEPYPDMRRVRVAFRLSTSRKSLGSAITLNNQTGEVLASANIVNMYISQNEITLHIPAPLSKAGKYNLTLSLFTLQEVESELEPGKVGAILSNPLDSKTISFTLQ